MDVQNLLSLRIDLISALTSSHVWKKKERMRSTCPAISRHLLFFYGGARRRNNENDNKISWYLRACVDDLRHGIERENLVVKPEKLVQTTGNFDINTNYIHGQQPFNVHT